MAQAVKKMYSALKGAQIADVERGLPKPTRKALKPHAVGLDEELDAAARVRFHPLLSFDFPLAFFLLLLLLPFPFS